MRALLSLVLVVAVGCGGDDDQDTGRDAGDSSNQTAGKSGGGGEPGAGTGAGTGAEKPPGKAKLSLPEVYPLVRASTPTALIANPTYQPEPSKRDGGVGVLPQALGGEVSLALAVQERFYMGGPTELLRIVRDLDNRLAGLDTDASKHGCLSAAPVEHTYALPGGHSFSVKLQCIQSFGGAPGNAASAWIAFGFGSADAANADDAGASAADGGTDSEADAFYLVEGQAGGMGGAYRIRGGDLEAWIAVADSNAPMNSRVIMHLITHEKPATSELALAGAAVGFCSAHLKTSAEYLFVQGRTNAPPPPGTEMQPGAQYCDAVRAGCFAVTALGTDLGADAQGCSAVAKRAFEIRGELDASNDAAANVMYDRIYTYFNQPPTGLESF